MNKKKFAVLGFLLGLAVSILVWLAEMTTGPSAWPLILSFPACWGFGGYLLARWNR